MKEWREERSRLKRRLNELKTKRGIQKVNINLSKQMADKLGKKEAVSSKIISKEGNLPASSTKKTTGADHASIINLIKNDDYDGVKKAIDTNPNVLNHQPTTPLPKDFEKAVQEVMKAKGTEVRKTVAKHRNALYKNIPSKEESESKYKILSFILNEIAKPETNDKKKVQLEKLACDIIEKHGKIIDFSKSAENLLWQAFSSSSYNIADSIISHSSHSQKENLAISLNTINTMNKLELMGTNAGIAVINKKFNDLAYEPLKQQDKKTTYKTEKSTVIFKHLSEASFFQKSKTDQITDNIKYKTELNDDAVIKKINLSQTNGLTITFANDKDAQTAKKSEIFKNGTQEGDTIQIKSHSDVEEFVLKECGVNPNTFYKDNGLDYAELTKPTTEEKYTK